MDKVVVDCTAGTETTAPLTADERSQAEIDAAAAIEGEWAALRVNRDARLAACDWTQLQDATVSDGEAWAAYRQQLRDLPENTADPAAPEWPEPPPEPGD